jgi:hypothetical protein
MMNKVPRPWSKEVLMAEVLCESVGPGMRESERAVTVRDVKGHGELILVEHDFLTVQGDKTYLPVGVCFIDKERDVVLVEFPHEAITGGNRLWVRTADLIWLNEAKP